MPAKIIERHRAEEIRLLLVTPDVGRVVKGHRRQHAIHENKQRQVFSAEKRLPVREPVDVFLRRPTLPHVTRLVGRSAGKLPPLYIDEQLRAGRPQYNEVKILDRHVAEYRSLGLIDSNVA